MQVLEAGGSAVDAAIAAAFADAVMQPASSGIGGGGVTIVVADGAARNYDYREVVNQSGVVPASGTGIPGFLAGMTTLYEEYGRLDWDELLQPAIALARDGAPVSAYLAGSLASNLGRQVTASLPQFRRADGAPLVEGDLLVQSELAATMQRIADTGPGAGYADELAAAMAAAVDGVDAVSLAAYTVQEGEPAAGPVGDYTMLSGAPALPGAAIIQMVQIAEAAGIANTEPGSAEFADLQSRAWQVADTSVQQYFGDPDFVDVPVEILTDPAANAAVAATLADASVTSSTGAEYSGALNTTHISVVDADGVGVSMTNTITNYWGSGQYVAGFFMNDQISRFGDIGVQGQNTPAPGRRSVTWSSPSMVVDDEYRPVLVIGAPGGRQIPNTTAQVVTLWALHGLSLEEAVPVDRFILDNGRLRLETDGIAEQMRARGYQVQVTPATSRPNYGSVQALEIDWKSATVSGFADPRRSAGFEVSISEP
ncbi:gamma-glutamyltransferase [Cellulomonas sp. ACRRI]|uniref:gamma-glutamyltransferase n=1 Tax=Cellulomonas sp. ACRRI TaxID=2918188 RepID=UPI001EF3C096|nr:gamma-glutamyltransferase [Cellulomonas sp. ACRRI]MCG7284767.1 gamma-glutamyltransferase [Cellulomonas sp. ACRRI]